MKTRRQNSVSGDRLPITTQRNKRSKTSGNSSSSPIPIDVLIEIFRILPVKSIATCRCVSKLWYSTLRRPDFTELFLSRSCSTSPKLLFACIKNRDVFFFTLPQPQNPDEKSPSVLVADYHMKFSFNVPYDISYGLNGLFCLLSKRFSKGMEEIGPVIWNPSTGESVILPEVKARKVTVKCLFGYDPIDKQFKILCMTKQLYGSLDDEAWEQQQVLTLVKQKMSWRMIECSIPIYTVHNPICINGVLSFISIKRFTKTCVIVCFDVRLESFSSMEAKGALNGALLNGGTLVNYNGKLGCVVNSEQNGMHLRFDGTCRSLKLWVREDVEKEEWSERIYLLPAMWRNVVRNAVLSFVGVTRTNEIVFSSYDPAYSFYLYYLNLERNTVVRVEIQGMDTSNCWVYFTCLDHVEDVKLYEREAEQRKEDCGSLEILATYKLQIDFCELILSDIKLNHTYGSKTCPIFELDFPSEYITAVDGCFDKVIGSESGVITISLSSRPTSEPLPLLDLNRPQASSLRRKVTKS
ncbi:unnamed protein product [Microthlaspi erraticum]|uniref:F-box domain-containing protein n=1 Tax=Microthlaspi erraticum TaxID=1685480 RepID=A0A6D2K4M5_9BRAS|nr:unnamed protein product [Microthlaspi erraticum]